MAANLRIITTGGNFAISEEIKFITQTILGSSIPIQAVPTPQISSPNDADLFICIATRVNELSKVIPPEKIVGLDLTLSSMTYVDMAKVPAKEAVHILNTNTRYAQKIAELCNSMGINHVNFVFVPFDELPENEVAEKLKQVKWLGMLDSLIESDYKRYKKYMTADVPMIKIRREATTKSVCTLMEWITLFHHKDISNQTIEITHHLQSNLEEVTAVAGQLSDAVKKNLQAFQTMQEKLHTEASNLQQLTAMSENLSSTAKNISNIADSIKRISSQTNLLALNATIEAARVGEYGRGFAVVAKEVGKLADESSHSTETIRKAIAEVQSASNQIIPALSSLSDTVTGNQKYFSTLSNMADSEGTTIMEMFSALNNINQLTESLVGVTNKLIEQK